MLVWLIHNGIYQEAFLNTIAVFQEAATSANIRMEIYETCDFSIICDDKISVYNTRSSLLPDYVILLAKDVFLARSLEEAGHTVLNSSYTIENASNKANTYILASRNGIPMPSTMIFPKLVEGKKTENDNLVQLIEEKFAFPFIIKEFFGSFGRQVYLIYDSEQLISKIDNLSRKGFIVQQYIKNSYGRDARLYVINHKVACSIKRNSIGDFRSFSNSNIKGNSVELYIPKPEEIEIAIKMSQILESFFISVDFIWDEGEQPLLCEVNSAANINSIAHNPIADSLTLAFKNLENNGVNV